MITFEELSHHDGLFNLCIKSILGLNDISVKQIAINDFVHDYGSYEDLCSSQGLNHKNLYEEVLNLLRINWNFLSVYASFKYSLWFDKRKT